jgi:hypothetical protein
LRLKRKIFHLLKINKYVNFLLIKEILFILFVLLVENWRSFAAAHDIPEEEAPLYFLNSLYFNNFYSYVSAATATETPEGHRERIEFTNSSLFRPWLCSVLT